MLKKAKLAHPRRPLLVHDAFDLPVGDPHVVLALRLQRNLTAKQSGCAVVVRVAVQIIAVTGRAVAAAIAGHVFQNLRDVLGYLIGPGHLRIGEARRAQGDGTRALWLSRQHQPVPQRGTSPRGCGLSRLAGRLSGGGSLLVASNKSIGQQPRQREPNDCSIPNLSVFTPGFGGDFGFFDPRHQSLQSSIPAPCFTAIF